MKKIDNTIVIVGGGVAGLCAAITLQENGFHAHMIEAGEYPAHKVCGEFLSPESLSILESWGIRSTPIRQARFHRQTQSFIMPFEQPAGGLSHLVLDPQLVEKAITLGATIQTGVKVESFQPKESAFQSHTLTLSTGQTLRTQTAIVATGRIPTIAGQAPSSPPPPTQSKYLGFKAHFCGIPVVDTLEMFITAGGYLGISPVEDHKVNIACLVNADRVKKAGSIDQFVTLMAEENPLLKNYLHTGSNVLGKWLQTTVPPFGFRSTPTWQDTYFIGDAAMAIPPACGGGLSLAIFTGLKAAQAILDGEHHQFQKNLKKEILRQMIAAKVLHQTLITPSLSHFAFKCCNLFPGLARSLYAATRRS